MIETGSEAHTTLLNVLVERAGYPVTAKLTTPGGGASLTTGGTLSGNIDQSQAPDILRARDGRVELPDTLTILIERDREIAGAFILRSAAILTVDHAQTGGPEVAHVAETTITMCDDDAESATGSLHLYWYPPADG
jgi:hypothetical protein